MNKIIDFLKENKVQSLLDIGANVGNFSKLVKHTIPDMNILMLEANPYCDHALHQSRIPYEIACLSDEIKTVDLYLNPKNYMCTGTSYYKEVTVHYDNADWVKTETKLLDDVVRDRTYEYIKMDTQGSELDILRGGTKTVEKAKYIQLEISVQKYNEGAPLKDEVLEYMKSIGFSPNILVENHYHEGQLIQEDWIFTR
jgi:FkbM family methyltransferase